ncbi:hypothetical protein [uncultured Actinomyces sp.]|uniref:hypothetical protein n=1 Tax=uncultured Actinomyces sp. TaxID=249061 RepID=UPI00288A127D|nr:hypothetical protein [uncultured Actinomyces sp.]
MSSYEGEDGLIDESADVPAVGGLFDSVKKGASIEHKRENVRGRVAYIFGGVLVSIIVVGALGWLVVKAPLHEWASFTAPIVTMIAVMAGYYYGQGRES